MWYNGSTVTDDPVKSIYDRIADRKGERNAFAPYEGGNGRIDRAVDLILTEDFPRSGTLLDVGGATGNLGYALRDKFEVRWTLDIVEACREPAEKKGNNFICANVDSTGFVEKEKGYAGGGIIDCEVDLICALDFIEHIVDPEKFARECFRVLRPGGKVLINTPNMQFWRHLESLVCQGVFPHTSGDREVYHGGHLAFFTLHDLKVIFGQAGFVEHRHHLRGLAPDPAPPIWETLLRQPQNTLERRQLLCYPDLIFSCKKP